MGKVSEIAALQTIDEALSALDDPLARNRILAWAWHKFSSEPRPPLDGDAKSGIPRLGRETSKRKRSTTAKGRARGKSKSSPAIVRDLNLKPKGKKSLDEFVEDKKPKSYYEKSAVVAYYLRHELSLVAISADHIYTCFKHMTWRIPANLYNTLAYTASRYGWLDTSNRENIRVTTMGENLVEHDLPRGKGSKKK